MVSTETINNRFKSEKRLKTGTSLSFNISQTIKKRRIIKRNEEYYIKKSLNAECWFKPSTEPAFFFLFGSPQFHLKKISNDKVLGNILY